MEPTDIQDPEYFHKVIDCQYACPAHTAVPEYLRLIAAEKYNDAYMINWESNVFPGVLGRTCDRPCEPACRRGRVEDKPVAICRLKRVCADFKKDICQLLPKVPKEKNGKRIALIGGGPASLTVARDLMVIGYECDLYDENGKAGGYMRSQIPSFRLPREVLDEEVGYILDMGVKTYFNTYVDSMSKILDKGYDAVFVGTGAPCGRDLELPGREAAGEEVRVGIGWLADVAFEHARDIGKKVLVIGGGNTAMDCCRTALRVGADEAKVMIRTPIPAMTASPWEIEEAKEEGIPILENHNPIEYVIEDGKLVGMRFEKIAYSIDPDGREVFTPTGEDQVVIPCDTVLLAIGLANSAPWIERDIGIEFGKWDLPVVDTHTFQSTHPKVFFGGDAAFGPFNIITAVAHGHQAALSIDMMLTGKDLKDRPAPGTNLVSQKMGIHEWSYASMVTEDRRYTVPHADLSQALKNRKMEVELGFDKSTGHDESQRCLNCDVQTVFIEEKCIECDACIDVCPVDCLTFTENVEEGLLRRKLNVPAYNSSQDIFVSKDLPTGRAMVKDEDVCLHCGLCAERCPTGAWDMQKYLYMVTKAGQHE
jgi:NADPH-dependent glutamate synthase beta subunit-like oxidoreductase/ferredoxin